MTPENMKYVLDAESFFVTRCKVIFKDKDGIEIAHMEKDIEGLWWWKHIPGNFDPMVMNVGWISRKEAFEELRNNKKV